MTNPYAPPPIIPAPTAIDRRRLLVCLLAGSAACALPHSSVAAPVGPTPSEAANRRFSVYYKGDRIGAHTTAYSDATGETRVTTEISLKVKALFFTVFAFSHQSVEVWQDGRLTSLDSKTVEDGAKIIVSGAATAQGFRVLSSAGPYVAAATSLTSNSLWTPAVLAQDTLIDAHHGGVIGVSAHRLPDEQLPLPGRTIRATRYRFITPYLAGSIWYDEQDRWVHGEFERDGAHIVYRLDD